MPAIGYGNELEMEDHKSEEGKAEVVVLSALSSLAFWHQGFVVDAGHKRKRDSDSDEVVLLDIIDSDEHTKHRTPDDTQKRRRLNSD